MVQGRDDEGCAWTFVDDDDDDNDDADDNDDDDDNDDEDIVEDECRCACVSCSPFSM